MARAVFSQMLLGDAISPGEPELEFVVPAGYVAVVRDISATLTTVSLQDEKLVVSAGTAAIYQAIGPPGATRSFHWEGRCVLDTGEVLAIAAFGDPASNWGIRISGYLLSD